MHLQVSVNRPYSDVYLLSCLIPIDTKGQVHVDEGRVGDHLTPTAGDLHAPKESKIHPFPDPGSCVHRNLQFGGDHHRVVVQKINLESVI